MPPRGYRFASIANTPELFWAKVRRGGYGECWPWLGASDAQGYGYFWAGAEYDADGRKHVQWEKAHRRAYALANDGVSRDLDVCHCCDNPTCCNPSHLFLGTRADNNADKDRKGRGNYHVRKGAGNANAKLLEADVLAIRARYAAGGVSQQELAEQFGVRQAHVSRIVIGKSWVEISGLEGRNV